MHVKNVVLGTLLPLFALSAHAQGPDHPNAKFAAVEKSGDGQQRFIVRYRDGANERKKTDLAIQHLQAAFNRANLNKSTDHARISHVRTMALGAQVIRVSRTLSPGEANAFMQYVAADPAVEYVEPDIKMYPLALSSAQRPDLVPLPRTTPAFYDPDPEKFWNLYPSRGGANVISAWKSADGSDVTVAVIDSGITRHPGLDLSLADQGYDFTSFSYTSGREEDGRQAGGWDTGDWTTTEPWLSQCLDSKGRPDNQPSSWHGTHVAGTAAARPSMEGGAGVAFHSKILPIRALGHCGGWSSDIADAIAWASGNEVPGVPDNQHHADVINLSLGGKGACKKESTYQRAIDAAIRNGSTVVVAAGNANTNTDKYSPASCDGVINVAATTIEGTRAWYSNYGSKVTLAAPGGDGSATIISTYNDGRTTPGQPSYAGLQGTSMATPHVSGTVALMVGARKQAGLPPLTPEQIKQILTRSASPFASQDNDHPIGAGILDAAAAVHQATLQE